MFFSVHTLDGDPQTLLAAEREHMDPVVNRLAAHHGTLTSVTVPTENGITVHTLWHDAEGAAAFTPEPDAQAAQRASGLPAGLVHRHPAVDATVH